MKIIISYTFKVFSVGTVITLCNFPSLSNNQVEDYDCTFLNQSFLLRMLTFEISNMLSDSCCVVESMIFPLALYLHALLQVLKAETPLSFEVSKISINRNGSALLLAGLGGLCVMYLYGRSSLEENTIICRYVSFLLSIYLFT